MDESACVPHRYHGISDTFLHSLSIMYLFVSNLLIYIYTYANQTPRDPMSDSITEFSSTTFGEEEETLCNFCLRTGDDALEYLSENGSY